MNKETLMEFLISKDSGIAVFTTKTLTELNNSDNIKDDKTMKLVQVELARRLFNDQ